MTEMIERVARAIYETEMDEEDAPWREPGWPEDTWSIHLDMARAAIAASRDYFDEMAKGVSNMGTPRTDNNYGRTAAVIDEVLKND